MHAAQAVRLEESFPAPCSHPLIVWGVSLLWNRKKGARGILDSLPGAFRSERAETQPMALEVPAAILEKETA